ncbi:Uncharacterized protein TCM_035569 [Theobroma cacao]|uniref:DUF4216 domain-containing protein n=1 Tax=Theobroma cacao TaxID=3641 RepID=A0A061FI50_THECC|nr:Uncharacterized protein TCM_035569 [Theobroma cacao]
MDSKKPNLFPRMGCSLGDVTYYGVLQDIIELDYYRHFNVAVLKCDWFQVKQDEFGFSLVNFMRLTSQNDPFVLASHVKQVFYIQDLIGMLLSSLVVQETYMICLDQMKNMHSNS